MKFALVSFGLFLATANCEILATNDEESNDIAFYGFEIYRKIYDASTNLVYSPLSFRVLYSILYQTSFGETENVLRNQLFANIHQMDKISVQSAQSVTLDRILSSDKVKMANVVYLAAGTTPKQNFTTLVAQYKSEVQQVDFSRTSEVTNIMNRWIEEKTNNLIQTLISEDSVSPDAHLFLINTLYFESNWLTPFTTNLVYKSLFRNIDGSTTEIDFIQDVDYYRVANSKELKINVLELKYDLGSNFKFWIIVPRDELSLAELKSQLSPDFMYAINTSISSERAQIKFPIFTVESTIDGHSISKVLFEQAELNILENSDPLKVDAIKQKTRIIVNTAGTQATTATYGKLQPIFEDSDEPLEVIADRPFIFVVLTQDRNEPIFIGHYVTANQSIK